MSRRPLSADELRQRVSYDPATGAFTWLIRRGVKAGAVPGSESQHGYLVITINRQKFYAHRLAWLYMKGELPECEIDHKDGDGLNNRFTNLRKATLSQNQRNSKMKSNNTTGFKGVFVDRRFQDRPYRARIFVNGKTLNLGRFGTAAEASAAYAAAAKAAFGEFARGS